MIALCIDPHIHLDSSPLNVYIYIYSIWTRCSPWFSIHWRKKKPTTSQTQPWVPWVSSRPDGRSEAWELQPLGKKSHVAAAAPCNGEYTGTFWGDLLEKFGKEVWYRITVIQMIHNSLLGLNGWQVQEGHAAWQKKTHVVLALMQDAQQVRKYGVWTMSYPIPTMFQHHSPMISQVSLRCMLCWISTPSWSFKQKNWILTGSAAAAGDPSKRWCYFNHLATWTSMSVKCAMYKFKFPQSFEFHSLNPQTDFWFLKTLKTTRPGRRRSFSTQEPTFHFHLPTGLSGLRWTIRPCDVRLTHVESTSLSLKVLNRI